MLKRTLSKTLFFLVLTNLLFNTQCTSVKTNNFNEYIAQDGALSFYNIKTMLRNGFDFTHPNYKGELPLQLIAKNPHSSTLPILEYLVSKGVPLTTVSPNNTNVLNYAVQNKGKHALKVLQYLLSQLANRPEIYTTYSPLIEASCNESSNALPMIKLLLQYKFDINATSKNGENALLLALKNSRADNFTTIKYLMDNGIDITYTDFSKQNIFHYIAQSKSPQAITILNYFLKHENSLVNAPDIYGTLPINLAVSNSGILSYSMTTVFLSYIQEKDRSLQLLNSLLLQASQNEGKNTYKLVDLFIHMGVNVNVQDARGYTPALYLAQNKSPQALKTLQLLVSSGGNIYQQTKDQLDILNLAALNEGKIAIHIVKYLEQQGLSLFHIDHHNKTLLHYAADNKGESALDLLNYFVDIGINPFIKDENGYSPLIHIVMNPGAIKVDLLKSLIYKTYQGKPEKNSDLSPVLKVLENPGEKTYQTLIVLVQMGFHINAKDEDGRNALIIATLNEGPQTLSILKYLILKGLQVNHQDKFGNTPLLYALENKRYQLPLIDFFLSKNANVKIKNDLGKNFIDIIEEKQPEEKALIIKILALHKKYFNKIHIGDL